MALCATPALAQSNTASMRNRVITSEAHDPFRPLEDKKENKVLSPAEIEAQNTWERYKTLAGGKPETKKEEVKAKTLPAQGLAGMIQQYGENQKQRGQMHVIHITPPAEQTQNAEQQKK